MFRPTSVWAFNI